MHHLFERDSKVNQKQTTREEESVHSFPLTLLIDSDIMLQLLGLVGFGLDKWKKTLVYQREGSSFSK